MLKVMIFGVVHDGPGDFAKCFIAGEAGPCSPRGPRFHQRRDSWYPWNVMECLCPIPNTIDMLPLGSDMFFLFASWYAESWFLVITFFCSMSEHG